MKKMFATILVLGLVVGLAACDKKGSSSSGDDGENCQVDQYGYCIPGTSGNLKGQAYENWVNVTDVNTYRDFMREIGACGNYYNGVKCNQLGYMKLGVDFYTTTFPGQGRIRISNGYQDVFRRNVQIYPIQGGYEMRTLGAYGTNSWNDMITVRIAVANSKDTTLDAVVIYRNAQFAVGELFRSAYSIPYQNNGYPNPYPYSNY